MDSHYCCFGIELCPKGDDPITIGQNFRKITFSFTSTLNNGLSGTIGIEFYGYTSFISLNTPSSANCINALQASPQIGRVSCTYSLIATNVQQIVVTFLEWPSLTLDNNLFENNGDPTVLDFYCDTSKTNLGVQCNFTDTQSTNLIGILYILLFVICSYVWLNL